MHKIAIGQQIVLQSKDLIETIENYGNQLVTGICKCNKQTDRCKSPPHFGAVGGGDNANGLHGSVDVINK
jgi:hypothetical protein